MNVWKMNLWYHLNTTDFLENIDLAPDPNMSDRKSALFDQKDNDLDGIYQESNWVGGYTFSHTGKAYTWSSIRSQASATNVCHLRSNSGFMDLTNATVHAADNSNHHAYGHYLIEYQTTNRFNINDTPWPFTLQQYFQDGWTYENQIMLTGQKPVLGYLTVANVEGRMCFKVDNDGTTVTPSGGTAVTPWTPGGTTRVRNAWGSSWPDNIDWVHNATWGGNYWDYYEIKSPVYTVFVVGESIREEADMIHTLSRIKITATVERTFDGRMNILEYRVGTKHVFD